MSEQPCPGASGESCSTCRCRFFTQVCHWRMNDQINTLFLYSFQRNEPTQARELLYASPGSWSLRHRRDNKQAPLYYSAEVQKDTREEISITLLCNNFKSFERDKAVKDHLIFLGDLDGEREKGSCLEPRRALFNVFNTG